MFIDLERFLNDQEEVIRQSARKMGGSFERFGNISHLKEEILGNSYEHEFKLFTDEIFKKISIGTIMKYLKEPDFIFVVNLRTHEILGKERFGMVPNLLHVSDVMMCYSLRFFNTSYTYLELAAQGDPYLYAAIIDISKLSYEGIMISHFSDSRYPSFSALSPYKYFGGESLKGYHDFENFRVNYKLLESPYVTHCKNYRDINFDSREDAISSCILRETILKFNATDKQHVWLNNKNIDCHVNLILLFFPMRMKII